MKTVRVTFAAFAIAIASVSVYANTLVATTFWRSSGTIANPNPGSATPDCAVQITTTECPATSGQICTIPDGDGAYYVISKKVDGPTCELARKTN